MLKKSSPAFLGFLQSTGLVVYLILIACFFNFMQTFATSDFPEFYAPIVVLLLFILSAVFTALLVLGKAGMLFWNKQYKESFVLLGWTLGWGFVYFISTIMILVFTSK